MERMSEQELIKHLTSRIPSYLLWRIRFVALVWSLFGDIAGSIIPFARVWVTPLSVMEPRIKVHMTCNRRKSSLASDGGA